MTIRQLVKVIGKDLISMYPIKKGDENSNKNKTTCYPLFC